MVQGNDLFAREAQVHPLLQKSVQFKIPTTKHTKLGESSTTTAVVRSPVTNILCILMQYAKSLDITVYRSGKNRKIVNVSELAETNGDEYSSTLLGICVFTGEDATSAFKGKGKVVPLKKLLTSACRSTRVPSVRVHFSVTQVLKSTKEFLNLIETIFIED